MAKSNKRGKKTTGKAKKDKITSKADTAPSTSAQPPTMENVMIDQREIIEHLTQVQAIIQAMQIAHHQYDRI